MPSPAADWFYAENLANSCCIACSSPSSHGDTEAFLDIFLLAFASAKHPSSASIIVEWRLMAIPQKMIDVRIGSILF